ncbi:MAG: hypothetical protein Q9198_007235 [Flavoplaca austrocitrina]
MTKSVSVSAFDRENQAHSISYATSRSMRSDWRSYTGHLGVEGPIRCLFIMTPKFRLVEEVVSAVLIRRHPKVFMLRRDHQVIEALDGLRESRLREHGYRYIRALTPSPVRYESRRRSITHESLHDDEGFGRLFDRSYLTPPMESRSYTRRRSHSREHSDPYHGGESYESRKRVRIVDV